MPSCLSDNTKNVGNTLLTFTIGLTESVYSIGLFSKLLPPSTTTGRQVRTRSVLYSLANSSLHSVIGESLTHMTQLNLLLRMGFELPDSFPLYMDKIRFLELTLVLKPENSCTVPLHYRTELLCRLHHFSGCKVRELFQFNIILALI